MDEKQLKEQIEDTIVFLKSVNIIMEDMVDSDLVDYLQAVNSSDWLRTKFREQLEQIAKTQKPKLQQRVG